MTNDTLKETEFDAIRAWIRDACGISLGADKQYFIQSHIGRLLPETGCKSFGELCERLKGSGEGALSNLMIEAITTRETMWFRDRGPWLLLEELFWPKLIRTLSANPTYQARVWSAATSTGQEAYSIAISFFQACAARGADIRIAQRFEVTGSDISATAIAAARRGIYDSMGVRRGLPDVLRGTYLSETRDGWAVKPAVRERVHFSELNLMHNIDSMGRFDLIFCRNLLIYFSTTAKQDLVCRIGNHLKEGASLLLGSAESLQGINCPLTCKEHAGYYYYTRERAAPPDKPRKPL